MRELTLGKKIKKLREDVLKMSQNEFAEMLKTTNASISRYENDKRRPKMYFTKEKLVEQFELAGIECEDLKAEL